MNSIKEILEDDVFIVNFRHKTAVNINQSGTLNEEKLEKEKQVFFRFSTNYLVDELVEKTQHYPHDDISEVDFETDFVVIKRRHYDEIKEFVEDVINNKELKLNE